MVANDSTTKPERKWVVMVYMGVDTVGANVDLKKAADEDAEELKSVGQSNYLDIFIKRHEDGRSSVSRVEGSGGQTAALVPWGSPVIEPVGVRSLVTFIDRSRQEAAASGLLMSRMLVLWGHAYDFLFGQSKTADGRTTALEFHQLQLASTELYETMKSGAQDPSRADATPLDVIGFDACDAATVEVAYQLRPFARYLLASQIGIPIPGWPYDTVLQKLHPPPATTVQSAGGTPWQTMRPVELGSFAVRRYCESYPTQSVSLTLLELGQSAELCAHIHLLAEALERAIGDGDVRARIAASFQRAQTAIGKPYVDLADLSLNLVRDSGDPFVMAAARSLGDFLVATRAEHGNANKWAFVAEHGRRGYSTAKLNGISIYAPHVAPENAAFVGEIKARYDALEFPKRCPQWSRVVHALAADAFGSIRY